MWNAGNVVFISLLSLLLHVSEHKNISNCFHRFVLPCPFSLLWLGERQINLGIFPICGHIGFSLALFFMKALINLSCIYPSICVCIYHLWIYEEDKERELPHAISYTNAHSNWDWTWLKPGARNSIQPPMCMTQPNHVSHCLLPPRACIKRKL